MIKSLKNPVLEGVVTVPGSKSYAHRMLICGALSSKKVYISNITLSDDIKATINCLNAMGAEIKAANDTLDITPIQNPPEKAVCDCGESGSTLRFLLPVAAALGIDCTLFMRGKLPDRPMAELEKVLTEHGVEISRAGNKLQVKGRIIAGKYTIRGDISSQYISGLEFALPLLDGESSIEIEGKLESAGYVAMTEKSLAGAGVNIIKNNNIRIIPAGQNYDMRGKYTVEGDWSSAAVWICAAAMQKGRSITVKGLNEHSLQGDRQVVDIIKKMGAVTEASDTGITVFGSALHAVDIDAAQIPDIIPCLACVCAVADGTSHIYNAKRLRYKESDRISSLCAMLKSIGADALEESDDIIIKGKPCFTGGRVDPCGDHRIAMAGAICAAVCENKVDIINAEIINKSYPRFWEDYERLCI